MDSLSRGETGWVCWLAGEEFVVWECCHECWQKTMVSLGCLGILRKAREVSLPLNNPSHTKLTATPGPANKAASKHRINRRLEFGGVRPLNTTCVYPKVVYVVTVYLFYAEFKLAIAFLLLRSTVRKVFESDFFGVRAGPMCVTIWRRKGYRRRTDLQSS